MQNDHHSLCQSVKYLIDRGSNCDVMVEPWVDDSTHQGLNPGAHKYYAHAGQLLI